MSQICTVLYSLELKYSYCFSDKWETDLVLKVQMYDSDFKEKDSKVIVHHIG